MQFRLSCPGCGKSLYVSHRDGGKEVLCRACGRRVSLPPGLGAPGELTPLPRDPAMPSEDAQPIKAESAEPFVGGLRSDRVSPRLESPKSLPLSFSPDTGRSQTSVGGSFHWPSALAGILIGVLLTSALLLGFMFFREVESPQVASNTPSPMPIGEAHGRPASKPVPLPQPASGPVAVTPLIAAQPTGPTTDLSSEPAVGESFVLERPGDATPPTEVAYPQAAKQPTTQALAAVEMTPGTPTSAQPTTAPSAETQPAAVAETKPATAPTSSSRPRITLAPVPRPAGVRTPQQLDQQIDQAIRRATNHLLTQANVEDTGEFALAAYAAIAAAQATNDPAFALKTEQMRTLIERLKSNRYETTYTRAIRAAALATTDRKEDRKALEDDVRWLIGAHSQGSYTYGPNLMRSPRGNMDGGDNSNSQYGLLGVWAGAEAGVEVPRSYWQAVEGHWEDSQSKDGRWAYTSGSAMRGGVTTTMTCAGIASMLITYDYLHADQFVSRFSTLGWPKELTRPLDWLSADNNALSVARGTGHTGYACYGLERVGLATGFKYFGNHDWYRELAEMMVDTQSANGSWGRGQSVITTSYFVLFLARGRHPVMANKLLHEGAWSNRPRDLANAARFVSKTVERPLNWQVVNLVRPGTDWLDAPILYLPSHQPLLLKAADYDKIRDYIDWGGLAFLHADGGSPSYSKWAETFADRVCRGAKLIDLAPTHPLYNVAYKLPATLRLKGVSNGSRLLVVLAVDDHAGAWQVRSDKSKAVSFQLFGNLFAYATGNVPPRNRVDTTYVEPVESKADHTLTVARLSYDGNWDPEPGAWVRFGRQFQWDTGLAVNVVPATATELQPQTSLVHLTGTQALKVDAAQAGALGSYVRKGGVLLIDACGGTTEFGDSVEQKLVPLAFPDMSLSAADLTLPPFAKIDPALDDLSARKLRPFTGSKIDRRARPMMIGQYGKGVVIYSPLDLTTGLLGTHVWGVLGHSPDYAKGVVKNILIWAGTMRPVE